MVPRILSWKNRWVGLLADKSGSLALTRWFAVVGALAIGLFSLGMAWLLSSYLATRMLQRDAALSRDFVQSIADIQQVSGFFRTPEGPPDGRVVEFFAHVAAMPDVLRANVYAPNRRVLWSSRPELIGKTFPLNDELDAALKGQVVVNREDEDEEEAGKTAKAEHQGLRADLMFVEDYLPVFDRGGKELIGVIELYRQPDALFAAIKAGQTLIQLGSAGGGAMLFLTLVWFVRRTERAIQDQRRRLVEAEALAIVGELSAAVAHSIRNPLVSIRTTAELHRDLGGEHAEDHAETMRNVDRIEHLVRTLLTYASDPSEHQTSADLAAVLREAAGRFAPELKAQGKHLDLDFASDLGKVAADPMVLAQVFNSLLANAAEATQPGDHIKLRARREGARAAIELSDTGSGIRAEQMQNIFKPFYTTKPRGLGLGLALSRRIVRRLGGELTLQSTGERGTRVQLHLPLGELTRKAAAETASEVL